MRSYKVISPSGMETEIQANDEDEVRLYGFALAVEPETKAKTAVNKARRPENKEA